MTEIFRIFPLFPLAAAADLPGHDPLQDLPELRIPDGIEALPHHLPVALPEGKERGCGRGGSAFPARGSGDLADGEEKAANLLLSGEFVDLAEDLLLQELELMQPDRGGDPDEEGAPFQRFGRVWAAIWGPTARVQRSRRRRSVEVWGMFLFLRIFWRISPIISGFDSDAVLRMGVSLTVCTIGSRGFGLFMEAKKII